MPETGKGIFFHKSEKYLPFWPQSLDLDFRGGTLFRPHLAKCLCGNHLNLLQSRFSFVENKDDPSLEIEVNESIPKPRLTFLICILWCVLGLNKSIK